MKQEYERKKAELLRSFQKKLQNMSAAEPAFFLAEAGFGLDGGRLGSYFRVRALGRMYCMFVYGS